MLELQLIHLHACIGHRFVYVLNKSGFLGVHEGDKIEFILYNGHGGDVIAIAILDEN